MNNNDLSASWIDVPAERATGSTAQKWCPLPLFAPNFRSNAPSSVPPASRDDVEEDVEDFEEQPVMVARTVLEMRQSLQQTPLTELIHRSLKDSEIKTELHRILQSIQCSSDYGVYFCESFRDPRRHYIDDYWSEVSHEAFGIEELHHTVGKVNSSPLPEQARARLHEFARLLDRLARRIDRVVLA